MLPLDTSVLVRVVVHTLIASGLLYFVYRLLVIPLNRQARNELVLDIVIYAMTCGKPLKEALTFLLQEDLHPNQWPSKEKKTEEKPYLRPPPGPFIREEDEVEVKEPPALPRYRYELPWRLRRRLANIETVGDLLEELARWPYMLPPDVIEILRAGIASGHPELIVPYCQRALRGDERSRTRAILAYQPFNVGRVVGLGGPSMMAVSGMVVVNGLFIFIVPKFSIMYEEMSAGAPLPLISQWVFRDWSLYQIVATLVLSIPGLLMIRHIFDRNSYLPILGSQHVFHYLDKLTPWRRYRMQRSFVHIMGLMLDAKVPELVALKRAAASTGNALWRRAADKAAADLKAGIALPDVLQRVCPGRSINWHWRQALEGDRPVLPALEGWLEYLDARAFRSEQFWGHIISTAIYLLYAATVGIIVLSLFLPIFKLLEMG